MRRRLDRRCSLKRRQGGSPRWQQSRLPVKVRWVVPPREGASHAGADPTPSPDDDPGRVRRDLPPIVEKLKEQPGFLVHVAFMDNGVFTVSEIWESQEQHDRWFDENVRPERPGRAARGGRSPQGPSALALPPASPVGGSLPNRPPPLCSGCWQASSLSPRQPPVPSPGRREDIPEPSRQPIVALAVGRSAY